MFIAIEGIDGAGKATQTSLLLERAAGHGLKTATFSFPGYGKNAFSAAIGMYLNGDFGEMDALPPHLIALLFAGDRFTMREEIAKAVQSTDLVVCDRYVASNLAHQGAKLSPEKWSAFFDWVCSIEFGSYGLPRPDLTIYLDVPVETASRLIRQKKKRSYTELKEDLHEKDEAYLVRCASVYDWLIEHGIAGPWCRVPVTDAAGELLAMEEVAEAVWMAVETRRGAIAAA